MAAQEGGRAELEQDRDADERERNDQRQLPQLVRCHQLHP
jgi:hypothetical protein